jgi:hypothetical protein
MAYDIIQAKENKGEVSWKLLEELNYQKSFKQILSLPLKVSAMDLRTHLCLHLNIRVRMRPTWGGKQSNGHYSEGKSVTQTPSSANLKTIYVTLRNL